MASAAGHRMLTVGQRDAQVWSEVRERREEDGLLLGSRMPARSSWVSMAVDKFDAVQPFEFGAASAGDRMQLVPSSP